MNKSFAGSDLNPQNPIPGPSPVVVSTGPGWRIRPNKPCCG